MHQMKDEHILDQILVHVIRCVGTGFTFPQLIYSDHIINIFGPCRSGDARRQHCWHIPKSRKYWTIPKTPTNPTRPIGDEMSDEIFVKIKQAVTASQKQTESTRQHVQDSREESFRFGREYTTDDVHHFIEETHKRKKKDGQLFFNPPQLQVLTKVGERVCTELQEEADSEDSSRPLTVF